MQKVGVLQIIVAVLRIFKVARSGRKNGERRKAKDKKCTAENLQKTCI